MYELLIKWRNSGSVSPYFCADNESYQFSERKKPDAHLFIHTDTTQLFICMNRFMLAFVWMSRVLSSHTAGFTVDTMHPDWQSASLLLAGRSKSRREGQGSRCLCLWHFKAFPLPPAELRQSCRWLIPKQNNCCWQHRPRYRDEPFDIRPSTCFVCPHCGHLRWELFEHLFVLASCQGAHAIYLCQEL